jgi:hypothetical protein
MKLSAVWWPCWLPADDNCAREQTLLQPDPATDSDSEWGSESPISQSSSDADSEGNEGDDEKEEDRSQRGRRELQRAELLRVCPYRSTSSVRSLSSRSFESSDHSDPITSITFTGFDISTLFGFMTLLTVDEARCA